MLSKPISQKAKSTGSEPAAGKHATLAYIGPFVAFVALLVVQRWFPAEAETLAYVRFVLAAAALATFSRGVIQWRPLLPIGSILLGTAVFVVWVAPDALWPGYRHFWLFQNSFTGTASSSLPPSLKGNTLFIVMRVVESVCVIPILEELFWRGWLMRWLIRQNFLTAPLGQYTPPSFWIVAVLFASEHGPYWEVGLIAGVAYNWWMVRTRSLADCIVAHAITNALLAAYVLFSDRWQYWL
jgi:uncharacterized protein